MRGVGRLTTHQWSHSKLRGEFLMKLWPWERLESRSKMIKVLLMKKSASWEEDGSDAPSGSCDLSKDDLGLLAPRVKQCFNFGFWISRSDLSSVLKSSFLHDGHLVKVKWYLSKQDSDHQLWLSFFYCLCILNSILEHLYPFSGIEITCTAVPLWPSQSPNVTRIQDKAQRRTNVFSLCTKAVECWICVIFLPPASAASEEYT